jgi:hypothetical protein
METKKLILTFLIANSLFWGLFPREAHCLVINQISKLLKMNFQCPKESMIIAFGIISYILTVFYVKKKI